MRKITTLVVALIAVASVAAQDKTPASAEDRGFVEFGARTYWGDVYGRPDLPFKPDLGTSKFNEYSDIRKNFWLRRARLTFDNLFGSNKYLEYQTQSAIYKNQSHMATIGEWGKFKLQIRYNEIPHVFSNTTRTFYSETAPGVYTMPLIVRQGLQAASSTGTAAQINNALPSYVATQLSSAPFFTPSLERRGGSGLLTYNMTPDWSVSLSFARESQVGTRPIGSILNSSPTASASSQPGTTANRQTPGVGAELPEPIDYRTNNVRFMTEYGKRRWAVQLGYAGSFFGSEIKSLIFDSPFATADVPVQIIAPGNGCTVAAPALNCSIGAVPSRGQMSTYPDNNAQYITFATAFDLTKHVRVMGSTHGGWLHQDDPFLPYTINSAITGLSALPASSLHGQRQTLAMNWTAVGKVGKNTELELKYRHYDYNNNTQVLTLAPVQGDTIGANAAVTGQGAPGAVDTGGRSNIGFNRRTLELSANYNFSKRDSARVGFESEWFDRSHRDVESSYERTLFGSLDISPMRDLLFRVSGRHQNRMPNQYQDDTSSDPVTGADINCTSTSVVFTTTQRCSRRFDEAARVLDRGDALLQYNMRQFTFTGSFQTIQSDFNQRGGVNSPAPLNFLAGTTRPYYLYGMLNDLSWIYTAEATWAPNPAFSAFVEYSREHYHKRMVSRSRTPTSGTQTILTCAGCDTANNDWESVTRDFFDTYGAGMDFFFAKRVWLSPYYTLAAGKGNVFSRALGDPTITSGLNQFVLTGTSTPDNYPETTTRIHELSATLKFKLTENLTPKLEYRYQQYDNLDYQTTPMTPYMGCVGAGAIVVSAPCVNVGSNLLAKYPSLFYPGYVVGDTAAARYLFLGADQPSYRAHSFTVTLEYRF